MAKEQQQQRPLAQKQNELAPGQDQPLLVDNDKELYTMAKVKITGIVLERSSHYAL